MNTDPSTRSPGVSVVVPVYRSAATLPTLVERVESALADHVEALEIILVNDGSRDATWETIRSLAAKNPHVHGVNLMRNFGQHGALLAGIREAAQPIIATIDDDLQNPPEEIPKLLAELADGSDVVYGTPRHEQHELWRNVASIVTKMALSGVMGVKVARNVSAFRVFRTELREAFADFRGPYVSIDVLLTWGAARFSAIRVDHHPRREGESHYTFVKLIAHALNMATGFSSVPLRVATMLGFAFTLFGAGVLLYVIVRYLLGESDVRGFTFLAATIAIFSGVQLFALGIFGEYLSRMHFRLMDRPSYQVRSRTKGDGPRRRKVDPR